MRSLAKSVLAFAEAALTAARAALPAYSHPNSPKKFTQHQHFAILALKDFLQTDYRGIVTMLAEWSDLRRILELTQAPHHTAVFYAERRLLKRKNFHKLLRATVEDARSKKILGKKARQVAIDSTGYDGGHVSHYYARRSGRKQRHFPKFTALCDTKSHLYLSGLMTQGPYPDDREFAAVAREGSALHPFDELLADAGYDAEHHHQLVRHELGARSIIPPTRGRPSPHPPTGTYRRRMATRFPKKHYGQRWQIESCISQDKRRFGSFIPARSYWRRCRALGLRLLVHNLALLLHGLLRPPSPAPRLRPVPCLI